MNSLNRARMLILVSGTLIIITIVFVLLGIVPPGMDPEVPFLFVITPLILLIILGVAVEVITILTMKRESSSLMPEVM